MTPNELMLRLRFFATAVLDQSRPWIRHPETADMVRQLRRSATGAYMNYAAAANGRSHRDFTAKLGVASEECDECWRWLELLKHVQPAALPNDHPVLLEAAELRAILRAAFRTARQRRL